MGRRFPNQYIKYSNFDVTFQRAQEIMYRRIPEAILTSPDNFDDVYDAFLEELEVAGVEEIEAQFTELVREHVELFEGNF